MRLVDDFLVSRWDALFPGAPPGGRALDVGLGDLPTTTVEWFEALAEKFVEVVGVDHDVGRVGSAQPFARPGLSFAVADARAMESAPGFRVIRAMNLLRGYSKAEALAAQARLGAALEEGGLLLEGSTDVGGGLSAFLLLRRRGGATFRAALVFATDFSRGFGPRMFRDVLPRDLRRSVRPGTATFALFEEWERAFAEGGRGLPPEEAFARASALLEARVAGVQVDGPRRLLWAPAGGVPAEDDLG